MYTVLMHPLTTFPMFLSYGLIAPFILRVVVGILRMFAGWHRYNSSYKWLSPFYFISGILLIIGLYTQIAAIAAIILVLCDYFLAAKNSQCSREQNTLTILTIAILVSLLFIAPGFFAFDLPL